MVQICYKPLLGPSGECSWWMRGGKIERGTEVILRSAIIQLWIGDLHNRLIHPSIHLFIHLSIYPSIHPPNVLSFTGC